VPKFHSYEIKFRKEIRSVKGDQKVKFLIIVSSLHYGFHLDRQNVLFNRNRRLVLNIKQVLLPGINKLSGIGIYNGKTYKVLPLNDFSMSGRRLGEFVFTRSVSHNFEKKVVGNSKSKKEVRVVEVKKHKLKNMFLDGRVKVRNGRKWVIE